MSDGVDRGYLRISLDKKTSGSLDKQRARIRGAVTAAGRDPDLIVWYEDPSVSGSKVPFTEREAGARLLADLRPKDRVAVTKIDRAARNVQDLLSLVQTVQDADASIRFIDNDINTDGPWGRFMLVILAAIAELEANIIGERRTESLASFREEGRWAVGKAPYGFVTVPNPAGRGLVVAVDPEVGPLVYEAIQRLFSGATYEEAKRDLDLSPTGFQHLLRNPRLAGMTREGDGVLMVGGVPRVDPESALLTLEEWTRLQEHLAPSLPRRAWNRLGYGRALECDVCDSRLYIANVNEVRRASTYRCVGKKHVPGQPGLAITVRLADDFIEDDFLRRYGDHPEIVEKTVRRDTARIESVSKSMVAIQEVTRRMTASSDPDELVKLSTDLVELHKARAVAEAMPTETEVVYEPSGFTIGDKWKDSDDGAREDLILSQGVYRVRPGRIPLDKKIRFVPRQDPGGTSLVTSFSKVRTGLMTRREVDS